MPICEKMKRVFSRRSSSRTSNSSSPRPPKPKATTVVLAGVKAVKVKPRVGKDGNPVIEIYKPHEVPQSKYRGPFDEQHLQSLATYSFPAAMSDRPRSIVSELSPMGTRAPPTRRNSMVSHEAVARKMIEGLTQALEDMEGGKPAEGQLEGRLQHTQHANRQYLHPRYLEDGLRSGNRSPVQRAHTSSTTLLSLPTSHTDDTDPFSSKFEAEQDLARPKVGRHGSGDILVSSEINLHS